MPGIGARRSKKCNFFPQDPPLCAGRDRGILDSIKPPAAPGKDGICMLEHLYPSLEHYVRQYEARRDFAAVFRVGLGAFILGFMLGYRKRGNLFTLVCLHNADAL